MLSPAQGTALIHRLLTVFKHSLNVLIVLDWGDAAELLTLLFSSALSVGNADFMAAGLKPSLISHNHTILGKAQDALDCMCACFYLLVYSRHLGAVVTG